MSELGVSHHAFMYLVPVREGAMPHVPFYEAHHEGVLILVIFLAAQHTQALYATQETVNSMCQYVYMY